MSFSFRTVLIGAALLAWAPGCGVVADEPDDERTDAPTGDDGDREVGEVPSADDPGGDDGTVDEVEPPPPGAPSSLCPSASFSGTAADAIAVTWSDDAVDLILRDGSTVALALPAETAPADAFPMMTVLSGQGVVVVTRGWITEHSPSGVVHATTRWFDRTGALVDELSGAGLWASQIAAGGTTVMSRSDGSYGYVARLADGSIQDLVDFDPWGQPLASGWLYGHDTALQRISFLHPVTLERRLLDAAAMYPALVEDGWVYLAPGGSAPALVHVTPEATATIALPALAGRAADDLALTPIPGGSWVHVTDWTTGDSWRLDRASGEVIALDTTPPASSELLSDTCGITGPTLTSSGEIVAGLRAGGDGLAAVTDVAGGTWRSLGRPYAQPGVFNVRETGGTFVLSSGDANNSYCPIVGWEAPASSTAVDTDAVQIVRPSSDVVRVLQGIDRWSAWPTSDGGCVTYTSGSDVGALVERTITDVAGEPRELGRESLIWIE